MTFSYNEYYRNISLTYKNMIDWLNTDDILNQVRDEYSRGKLLVDPIRKVFKTDLRRYYNEKKKKEKVWDTTIYNVHSALLARMYVNAPQINFDSFDISNQDIVNNLNNAFKEDYECQEMEIQKYQQIWDALFYWVGIVAKTGWDWYSKKNKFQVIDPRTFIPDPNWDYANNDYSFIGFEKKVFKSELEGMWVDTSDLYVTNIDWWPVENQREDQQMLKLSPTTTIQWDNPAYEIYYHFTSIGTTKYCIVTGNSNTHLISIKKIEPVYSWEKKNKQKIAFPFSFKYFKPVRNNPFGYRVTDLLRDVQDTKALIANLRLDKSKAELYPMYLRNTRLIKNKTDLDFGFNKIVDVNPLEWEPLSNAIQPMVKDFRADNSYLIDDSLDRQVQSSTSIGKLVEWSAPERRETATTNRLQQGNTDINLSLIEKTMAWGDKQLAELWFRGYLENFTAWDSKKVKFYTWYGLIKKELTKKDFLITENISIYVQTNTEKLEKQEKQRIAFSQVFPLLQTLEIPKSSMNFAYRQLLLANWLDNQQVDIIIPKTPQEILAEENVELLKMWEFVEVEPDYDPFTHLTLLKQAWNGVNVELYRQWLLDLYKIQWGINIWGVQEANEALWQNIWAQAMSQLWNLWQSLQSNY